MPGVGIAADVPEGNEELDTVFASLKELVPYLTNQNPAAREASATYMFEYTFDEKYTPFFRTNPDAVEALISLARNEILVKPRKLAFDSLVNLSGDEHIADSMVAKDTDYRLVAEMVTVILDPHSGNANQACAILANLTRQSKDAIHTLVNMTQDDLYPCDEGATRALTRQEKDSKTS